MAVLAILAKKVWCSRRLLVLLIAPLLLLPVVFALPPKEGRCLFVILLMAVYWCTEALPLSVTALLPIILFPFLGILKSKDVCPQYFVDTNFLFLSGLIMASAIEEWNLHRRIALKILTFVGVRPVWLIFGMMVSTAFLSMWLSNTASTAMMLPIASAILKNLFGEEEENTVAVGTKGMNPVPMEMQFLARREDAFPQSDVVNFGSWFIFALPLMVLFLLIAWLWISFLYGGLFTRGWKKDTEVNATGEERARAVIQEEYKSLGHMVFAERAVFVLFCMFAILLFFRDPKFIPGWSNLFKPGFTSDAVTGVSIVTILFFFPSKRPSLKWWCDFKAPNTETKPLLTWKRAEETIPWSIILLLGGGFAMAKACEQSGLSLWISDQLHPLENVSPALAVFIITCVVIFFTEFASNTATIIIFLPVMSELAIRLKVHPLYLMIPATVGCSYAFMLPVSTPPNSIAFATGHLLVKDMVRTGLLMNLMGIMILNMAINTWAQPIFQLGSFPDWAQDHLTNVTGKPPSLVANDTLLAL
ncbi:solute carrier family 13 member 3 isoform X3 [Myotis myotis]|uniref:Solute carrier family 13 member 3 n=1 Tax=Myotis myotis TaxID=51298 RepID=A0A7J7W0I0_MYOMY|nr:solute carrier family 13 member 3 isoform X3 [Myotis myotis]KAF6330997.1 solute carrier family 13 member 3 [Myotis myotis]